mmetsp:Transcript_54271/g.117380  ORF Transcript_54271/g.117380 Transcript_54271/m.117380 type:complete len:125 (+) Transcript_54271:309-683(+)
MLCPSSNRGTVPLTPLAERGGKATEHFLTPWQLSSHFGLGHEGAWHFHEHLGCSQTLSQGSSPHCVVQTGGAQTDLHFVQFPMPQSVAGQTTAQCGSAHRVSQVSVLLLQSVLHCGGEQTGSQV